MILKKLTWDEVAVACDTFIQETIPDFLIGISRDGVIPVVYMSHRYNIPMDIVKINREDNTIKSLCDIDYTKYKNIWVVDDVYSTGRTLKVIKDKFPNLKTMVLYCDNDKKIFVNYSCFYEKDIWYSSPWDIGTEFVGNKEYASDSGPVIAYDLDGVVFELENMAGRSLEEIHVNQLVRKIKMIPQPNSLLITYRPEVDREVTELALKNNNIQYKKLIMLGVMENGDLVHDKNLIIERKALAINAFKVSTYYEDSISIIEGLKKKCFNCNIVEVK